MNIELPIHPDAEKIVLGKMMCSIDSANILFENLEETDFQSTTNRAIFRAGYALFKADRGIDPTAILAQLEADSPAYADYSMVNGLHQMAFFLPSNVIQYIELVRDYSVYRKTILFSKEMMDSAASKKLTSNQLKNKFLEESDVIFKGLNSISIRSLTDVGAVNFRDSGKTFLEYVEFKQEMARLGQNTISGYLSSYTKLDDCLEGWNRGHYIIVGARPGIGKTTFIMNLMKNFTQRNLKVGFFSLEMAKEDVLERFACIYGGVDYKKMKRGTGMTTDDFQAIVMAYKSISDSIYIDDQPNLYLSQLSARAKRMVNGLGVQILFIDYLSEVKGELRFPNKQEEMQHVSKGIRAIAKNLNVPVICIAQLNRESEKQNRIPIKSDLRESGQIEADAYSILLLHRDEKVRPGILSLAVVKNRLGKESVFDFTFDGSTGQIKELGYYKQDYGATTQANDPYAFLTQEAG